MQRLLALLVDTFWMAIAAVLIAFAAAVAAVRLLLPEIGDQREQLAAWIGDSVGRQAVIGEIDADWHAWSPSIRVEGIAFIDPTDQSELVRFDKASINIDLVASLSERSLRPKSIVLSGVALTLLRDANGKLSVAGMPPPKSPIIQWLVEQDNFAVTGADLTIIDERAHQSFALSNATLAIRQRNGIKLITTIFELPAAIGDSLTLALEADGNPLRDGWHGKLDIHAEGLNSQYWLDFLNWREAPKVNARIDLNAWTVWHGGSLQNLRFALASAATDQGIHPYANVNARGLVRRRTQGWRMDITELAFGNLPQQGLDSRLGLVWHTKNGELQALTARANDVPIGPLGAALARLDHLPPAHAERLRLGDLSGVINAFEGAWLRNEHTSGNFTTRVSFAQLTSRMQDTLPGISGIAGALALKHNGGRLSFNNSNAKLEFEQYLVAPWSIDKLDGELHWRWRNGLNIKSDRLLAEINGNELMLAALINDFGSDQAYADAAISITSRDATRVHELVPKSILPAKGERWVRQIIAGGEVSDARAVLRGPLARFPFRQAEGVFDFGFEVHSAKLHYSSRWPLAEAVDGAVRINGSKVSMSVKSGKVLGANITQAEIKMPDLFVRQRQLEISGSASGPASSARDIVMASPLKNTRAARLSEVDIDGDIDVDLDMHLALYPGGSRDVLGQAHFDGNRITARKQNIALDEVTGTFSFTRGDWYGEGITAVFENTPVGLVANGGLDDPNYDIEFRMTGTSPASELLAYLERYARPLYGWLEHHRELDSVSGKLPWKAVLTIPRSTADTPSAPQRLQLESTLHGLDVDLPWPFGKRSGERKPVRIEVTKSDTAVRRSVIDFGDTLDAEIKTTRDSKGQTRFERFEVIFGSLEPQFSNKPGIHLSGYIPELPLGEWSRFTRGATDMSKTATSEMPVTVDVQLSALSVLGQYFQDIRIKGERGRDHWLFALNGDDIRGALEVPRNQSRHRLKLDFERLRLRKAQQSDHTPATATSDPRRLPAMDMRIQSFAFNEIELGEALLTTERVDNGLALTELRFTDSSFALTATGAWHHNNDVATSHFDIDVSDRSLSTLLDRFGYQVANIKDGKTNIRIDASWPGTPADFRLAQLAGKFELDVKNGSILDIEPGGGRLFGLLSVQTLPRRLSLDFDDLFGKGFAFDTIAGVFQLENGNAYTSSLLMDGPSARIDISGRTGLTEQDYDQHVTVTPSLSNTIPVAGALFGPIGVGAGAVYYLGGKMFKSIPEQINRFLSREYAITGSWQNPTIDRI